MRGWGQLKTAPIISNENAALAFYDDATLL